MKAALMVLLMASAAVSAASDCSKVETSVLDRQACYNRMAEDSGDHRDCFSAPIVRNCIVNLAVEKEDPAPILAVTEGEGPSVIGHDERDRLLQQYVTLSMDLDSLALIGDNRIHDETLILSMPIIFSSTGLVPTERYCEELKGGYEYDGRYGQTVQEEETHNYNSCLAYGAALRQLRDGGNECHGGWTSRIRPLYGHEKSMAVADCMNLTKYVNKKYEELFDDRWILVDTRINQGNEPTKFVAGVTPGFYSDRYMGKVLEFGVSESAITVHDRDVDRGVENYDANFKAELTGPPAEMRPGENITISARLTGSGSATPQWAGSCSSALRFEYRADGVGLEGDTRGTICMDFKEQDLESHFTVPPLRNGEITVTALLWNCGACNVQWVYRRAADVIPEIEPAEADRQDLQDDFSWQEEITTGSREDKSPKGIVARITGAIRSVLSKIRSNIL
ncbi:MAG: hypothetical protein GF416_07675 [Candidatus Altiarchaeales archaeon]|nr:hypothetical protein [Candidatus Altiarchaeales archaeon]MBD3416991.1 hypothetical protein [Candidatus Altiarchaeales archaeon]